MNSRQDRPVKSSDRVNIVNIHHRGSLRDTLLIDLKSIVRFTAVDFHAIANEVLLAFLGCPALPVTFYSYIARPALPVTLI